MYFDKMNRLLKSTTVRLAFIFMALMGTSFLILGALFYWGMIQLIERDIWLRLDGEIVSAERIYTDGKLNNLVSHIDERRTRNDPYDEYLFVLVDENCQVFASTENQFPPNFCQDVTAAQGWHNLILNQDEAYVRAISLDSDYRLLAGVIAIEVESARYLMRQILSWGLVMTFVLSAIASIFLATSVERRLEPINRISRQIRLGNLSTRVPLNDSGDEFDRLARNLNDMLDEIQLLMDGIRHVSDTIAHDLRTPLTVLRGHLEDLQESGNRPDRATQALAEVDRLLKIFRASLRIAQIEAGNRRVGFKHFDIRLMLSELAEFYEPLMNAKGLRISVGGTGAHTVEGDRDLVLQALSNLVDNAIRFAPENSCIDLAMASCSSTVSIAVADSGPGIPEEERPRVFERFYRVPSDGNYAGVGLGLSLVAAVARLHGGRVLLEDNEPGLRAIMEFPIG